MIFWGLVIALLTSKLWLGESIIVENPTYVNVCISFGSGWHCYTDVAHDHTRFNSELSVCVFCFKLPFFAVVLHSMHHCHPCNCNYIQAPNLRLSWPTAGTSSTTWPNCLTELGNIKIKAALWLKNVFKWKLYLLYMPKSRTLRNILNKTGTCEYAEVNFEICGWLQWIKIWFHECE